MKTGDTEETAAMSVSMNQAEREAVEAMQAAAQALTKALDTAHGRN